ncbi:MAG TPA: hypothetical protein VKV40_06540 [Ktedonobacteraceae bacterium]|nr:hypothetical protein [Ktedonobacteraceae bacterium]
MAVDPVQQQMQVSTDLSNALQAMLSTLIQRALNAQVVDKNGKPLQEVCYIQLPLGIPADPESYSDAWTPAGSDSVASLTNQGKIAPPPASSTSAAGSSSGTGSTATTPPPPAVDAQMQHSMQSAANIAALVDTMMKITTDGTYIPYEGAEQISQAYQAIIMKAQGIPAPPPPPDIQAKIDAASKVLWVYDNNGNNTYQQTPLYSNYETLSAVWAAARTAYAQAEAAASTNSALAAAWPVTSQSLQVAVDNAWNDWRSSGADQVENALDTLGSVGGAVGPFFLNQARELFKAWDLGLTGYVPVGTPYSYILPASWWDATDKLTGFRTITVDTSSWQSSSSTASSSMASNWYQGHSSSTSAGGFGMIFGVTFGAEGGTTSSSGQSGSTGSGSQQYSFDSQMSDVSISFEYGLCDIKRPWMLAELFQVDGWYIPGEKAGAVSDGTISNQIQDDVHLLPMIPTQFLVVRNVKIKATGWGQAGDMLAQYSREQQSSNSSSSSNVAGGIGFLGIGAEASHQSSDFSGSNVYSSANYAAWSFKGSHAFGELDIPGAQIVGFVGEILPKSPRVDSPPAAAGTTSTSGTPGTSTTTGSTPTN